MTVPHFRPLLTWFFMLLLALPAVAAESTRRATASSEASKGQNVTKYTLRYKFQPGEILRWNVVDRKRIRMTFAGATKTTDSVSRSTKSWRVIEVDSEGNAVLENMVEDVEMRQKMSDRDEIRYNSKKDKKPPRGFQDAAKRVGRPLARLKLSDCGRTLDRTPLLPGPTTKEKQQLTIPLPDRPVAVGESWQEPHDVMLPLENGTTKKILTQQVFTLASVKTGVATVEVANQVLTPIHSPALEAKLIERQRQGTVRFDIDAGRVIWQQMDLDRRVIGFRGPDSALHYLTRFTEKLLPQRATVAERASGAKHQ